MSESQGGEADPTAVTFKAYTPFSAKELRMIDEWGFAKHIRSRAAAIRQLVRKALASEGTERHQNCRSLPDRRRTKSPPA